VRGIWFLAAVLLLAGCGSGSAGSDNAALACGSVAGLALPVTNPVPSRDARIVRDATKYAEEAADADGKYKPLASYVAALADDSMPDGFDPNVLAIAASECDRLGLSPN
jgi:hypothetical protein